MCACMPVTDNFCHLPDFLFELSHCLHVLRFFLSLSLSLLLLPFAFCLCFRVKYFVTCILFKINWSRSPESESASEPEPEPEPEPFARPCQTRPNIWHACGARTNHFTPFNYVRTQNTNTQTLQTRHTHIEKDCQERRELNKTPDS